MVNGDSTLIKVGSCWLRNFANLQVFMKETNGRIGVCISQFHVTPDVGLINRNMYIECFYCFQFCDTCLEVPLKSMNMYQLELTPKSYA